MKFKDIIINYPFWELFLGSKTIHHKRKNQHKDISLDELESILASTEKLCLDTLSQECERLYGMGADSMQIILSRVNKLSIDWNTYKKTIGRQGSQIQISLVNAFIPSHKYNLISQIWNVLWKNIYRILPSEYCITKIFPDKNLLIINIGATQTSVSVKRDWILLWISKTPIWINDLVNKISKSSHLTKAQIIRNLSCWEFEQEKTSFMKIWWDALWMSLWELLWNKTCPKKVYLWWGGANNVFIREYIEDFDFLSYWVRSLWKVEFVTEEVSPIIAKIKNININDIQNIPLEIYVLLEEIHNIILQEWDVISSSLKKAIKKLWYISNI